MVDEGNILAIEFNSSPAELLQSLSMFIVNLRKKQDKQPVRANVCSLMIFFVSNLNQLPYLYLAMHLEQFLSV